jgi:ABC-type Mn2+/Zn2+ transport system ATPase subunit
MLRRRNDTSLRKPVAPVRPGSRERENPSPEWATKRPTTFPARRRATALGMSSNPTGTVGIPPERGAVEVGGREVALALQRSQVGDTFPITVAEAVAMGRWRRLGLLRRPSRTDRDIVSYWIAEMGLDELAQRRLGDLQRQRVLFAQAFAQQAPVCAAG